ncbi:glycosyltransferase [bacterium]|nr:glycosyltransferase [bacterium]
MSNKNFISVIICTYNRCACLSDILNSLLDQEYKGNFDYEIIVVDNNSRDDTGKVVKEFQKNSNGRLRYVFEGNQGLSYARNSGVKESKGDIVAFIDDDAIAERDWLKNLYNTFDKYKADSVGGKTIPILTEDKPKWLTRTIWANIGLLDYGEEEFIITTKKYPILGANMAFSKKTLLEIGVFNIELGRIGEKLFSHEETDIFNKMLLRGKKIVYQPKAIVRHSVTPDRLKKSYFRRWHFYDGVLASRTIEDRRKYILGVPFWVIIRFIQSIWLYLKENEGTKKFSKQLIIFYYSGIIVQRFRKNII